MNWLTSAVIGAGIIVAALFAGFMIRDIVTDAEYVVGRKWLTRYLILLPLLAGAGVAAGYFAR